MMPTSSRSRSIITHLRSAERSADRHPGATFEYGPARLSLYVRGSRSTVTSLHSFVPESDRNSVTTTIPAVRHIAFPRKGSGARASAIISAAQASWPHRGPRRAADRGQGRGER
jgi:hypothetical protein